jgi:hypothetical protein
MRSTASPVSKDPLVEAPSSKWRHTWFQFTALDITIDAQNRRHRGETAHASLENCHVIKPQTLSIPEPRQNGIPMTPQGSAGAYEWIELQRLLGHLQSETPLTLLTPRAIRLLEWIVKKQESKLDLPLQNVTGGSHVGTAKTIYQLLFELDQRGFIDIEPDPLDCRRRLVRTTQKTDELMQTLSKSVEHWGLQLRSQRETPATDSKTFET